MITGKHLIAGQWIGTDDTFATDPAHGAPRSFSVGTVDLVNQAAQAAQNAFFSFSNTIRKERAAFIRVIADEIDVCGDAITEIGCQETGLPEARLIGERGRTVGQLRLFADHIEDGSYLSLRHDKPLLDRVPLPRPDMRMIKRPIGPVAVFGASNFPLAFSVAGGDTAAALAAGCPVIVKGHSSHPGTGEIVAKAIDAAVQKSGVHPGVFSLIQGGRREVGQSLVQHPVIQAVGFTGSLVGGRALFDLCAARPSPIPFFGELGSVNPVFMMPHALESSAENLGSQWAASLTMGAGQFCTNPGIVIVVNNSDAQRFVKAANEVLISVEAQTMLTSGITHAYHKGCKTMESVSGVETLLNANPEHRSATPALFTVDAKNWMQKDILSEEIFGPAGLIVLAKDTDEMIELAKSLKGQLTCSLFIDDQDNIEAKELLLQLEQKAGRLLANNFPTGVEVSEAMVHGGPYPASTNFGATSVGTLSIERFLRPVCFQNIPDSLLPEDCF